MLDQAAIKQQLESWMVEFGHWVGFVEESVFDVNVLVINEKNIICTNYDKNVFGALDSHGITPHIVNFRHRYFWDGGLHCITSDVHREGTLKDYFTERE
jgi:N-dimethylarginine dimethylaminohydrolase